MWPEHDPNALKCECLECGLFRERMLKYRRAWREAKDRECARILGDILPGHDEAE